MDDNNLELELAGDGAPQGEIGLDELAAIARSLQQLATRVGRHVGEQQGPGRTAEHVDRVTRLRLTGLRRGSTILSVAYGEDGVLPLDDVGLEQSVADRFWEIIAGIRANQRPKWAGPLVADAALALRDALAKAASRVELRRADQQTVVLEMAQTNREAWRDTDQIIEETRVTGRLEAVDLRARRFRIRDDVGNAIPLETVDDAENAGRLVGQRATATGIGINDDRGRFILRDTRLMPSPLRSEWTVARADLATSVSNAREPGALGITDLTDEEADAFLDAVRQM